MSVLQIISISVLMITVGGCAAQSHRTSQSDALSAGEPHPPIMPASDAAPQPITRNVSTPEEKNIALAVAEASRTFADTVVTQRNVPAPYVHQLLSEASVISRIIRLMTPSASKAPKSWSAYRQRFVEPVRIRQGKAFWFRHQTTLDRVSAQYGVPASILVAIIGVETLYGQQMGNFRVLDALYTLGFYFPDPDRPERAAFFREQLADLIELDYAGKLDARTVKGSYAGALGIPQFMPGSLIRYAVDGDGDGVIDLLNNTDDAIASVANFLHAHGWQPGLPVFAPVRLPDNAALLVHGGLKPTLRWEQLRNHGAAPLKPNDTSTWMSYPLGVIDLPEEALGTAQYRIATPNFFALTEYNRSYFYATAVTELAQALAQELGYGAP